MFTTNSIVLSEDITSIFSSLYSILGQAFNSSFNTLIKKLFVNNEQGFAYDPNDLTTLYQDAAGNIPVTAAGQPVGLVLDKSKGLVLGGELLSIKPTTNTVVSEGSFTTNSTAFGQGADLTGNLVVGRTYKVNFKLSVVVAGSGVRFRQGGVDFGGTFLNSTTYSGIITAVGTKPAVIFSNAAGSTFTVSDISFKEISGNHAYQNTSSMRPLLQDSPCRIDYDAGDDKLITNLPAQLTGCTVIRAVPNVGTQILTNQTIATLYDDSTDHCGLIVINRALTATETAQITQLFNKAAGV